MNKFSAFYNDTLTKFYGNRMCNFLEESMGAEWNGDRERATILYRRYLKYKSKWEKCIKRNHT